MSALVVLCCFISALGVDFLGNMGVVCSRKLTYIDSAWGEGRIELKLMFEPKLEVLPENVHDTN